MAIWFRPTVDARLLRGSTAAGLTGHRARSDTVDLFEYQGKQYFARYDIPVSPGGVAYTVDEAVAVAEQAGYPVVVKAQVQVGGRGKAGGIKLADNADEVRVHAGNIIGMDIKGHVVKRIWVEHASDITKEYYASFTLDRSAKKHLLMLSAEGGVEIETVAETNPDAIVLVHIDPVDGLSPEAARAATVEAKIDEEAVDGVTEMLVKLYRCFVDGDCDLAEINPLILRPDGGVHALDAKVSLDNNAAFRHPEWDEYRATEELDDRERMAREHDLQYIGLDGTVGIIANGAGLAMSTLDVVNQVGGTAANFLDIGGGANADVMAAALEVINFDQNVKSIFINIFGGITRGEEVAKGIVEALGRVDLRSPIVIRLDGTNAEEGRQILLDAGIPESKLTSKPTMLEAARAAVALSNATSGEGPAEQTNKNGA
jgi:succinyl-CoA synthetase beta subunit